MRRAILGLAIGLLGCLGCLHAPMPWSSDGSWIAYAVEVHAPDQIMAPGFLYDLASPGGKPPAAPTVGYQLWATRAKTNTSVLLEDSRGPITAPGWNPDGHALAFGRVVTDADRSTRFEVVILEGLTRRRVVASRPLGALDGEVARLPYQAIAWSPDGRYLAIPQLEPVGLAIIRADNGRIINTIPDAFLPSWSPTGGRLAFYIRSGGHALHFVDSALGQPRHLLDVGQASQAPAWSRDGTSLVVVTRRSHGRLGDGTDQIDLIRIRLDNSGFETIRNLSADLGPNRDHPVEGTSITFDRDAENLFAATVLEGLPSLVTWYRPRNNEVYKKFSVVDYSIPVGSLSFSPDGRTLAARVGTEDHLSAPVLYDTEGGEPKTRLVAPDDPARLEWIAILVRSARTILSGATSTQVKVGKAPGTAVARPTILPLLTDLNQNPEASLRLKRLGQLGRPLCDRPAEAPELSSSIRQVLDEARLFFDYLREDYSAALVDLETLEAAAVTPVRRLAVLAIRAQVLVNQGQFVAAKRVIGFLEEIERSVPRRAEWVGARYVLTPDPRADRGWSQYLAEVALKLRNSASDDKRTDPNFDFAPSRASALFGIPDPIRVNPLRPPGADEPVPRRQNGPRGAAPRAPGQPRE